MNNEQFRRGVEEFNKGFFFECHDTLEEMWMETRGIDRLFLQGLIQVSVGFYHLFNKNFKGAVSQFTKGSTKLERYRPVHNGVDVSRLLEEVRFWLDDAEKGVRGVDVEIDETEVPKIHYTSDLTNGKITWQQ